MKKNKKPRSYKGAAIAIGIALMLYVMDLVICAAILGIAEIFIRRAFTLEHLLFGSFFIAGAQFILVSTGSSQEK